MKILVTGGTGFIGSYVLRELIERGDDVIGFDIQPLSKILDKIEKDKLTWIQGDIRNQEEIESIVSDHQPEVIINLAALLQFGCMENPRLAIEVNILGFSNVLEAAMKYKVPRVVTASSAAVYRGRQEQRSLETSFISPGVTLYGATKFLNEVLSRQYIQNYGLEAINLRFYGVYGPGEVRSPGMAKVIKEIESIATGKSILLSNVRATDRVHLVFVADAAHSVVLAATASGPFSLAYNIAGVPADFVTFSDIVSTIKKLVPTSGDVRFEGKGVPRGFFSDSFLAKKELGYEPQYTMETGLKESIAFFKQMS